MAAASDFSLLGASNTAAGAGDTEDARYETSVQYRVNIGAFRLAALYQFGGYEQGNGSNGAVEGQVGGDFGGFSFDAVGSKVKVAVSLSNYGVSPLPAGVSVDNLKATLSDTTSGSATLARSPAEELAITTRPSQPHFSSSGYAAIVLPCLQRALPCGDCLPRWLDLLAGSGSVWAHSPRGKAPQRPFRRPWLLQAQAYRHAR